MCVLMQIYNIYKCTYIFSNKTRSPALHSCYHLLLAPDLDWVGSMLYMQWMRGALSNLTVHLINRGISESQTQDADDYTHTHTHMGCSASDPRAQLCTSKCGSSPW